MKKVFVIIFILITCSFAQSNNPELILKNVKDKFAEVKDYTVDAKIKINVNFLKAPLSEVKIYFKQPDKIHLESENFAMLPKEGINFSPLALLKGEYTAIYEREDTVNGKKTSVIKIIPLGDKGDIVLTTLWVDQTQSVIMKVESTTKINGTFSIELNYPQTSNIYPLPASMFFTFNFDKNALESGIPGNLNDENKKEETMTSGTVRIDYSHYKVNQGLSDSIFEQKKK